MTDQTPIPEPGGRPGERVVVAMSGGVDSAVAAALLQAQGRDVVGVTLQLYDQGATAGRKGSCCAGRDIDDARRAADRLRIPHYVLDYERRFSEAVIAEFVDSYRRGETPIPCVQCNQTIKFGDLLATARELGAARLATGHYVRRIEGEGGPELHRAADRRRDQSYFLFSTPAGALARLEFPLGGLAKDETRALAAKFGLGVADKPDSQDICFVPGGDYARAIAKLDPAAGAPGEIVDLSGRVVGRHQGVIGYTVGQRRGLGGGEAEPRYVIRIEAAARRVVVGPRSALFASRVRLREVNWLRSEGAPRRPLAVTVKLRSHQPAVAAEVTGLAEGGAEVVLAAPQAAVAPGQACVFYQGERVLGGGWIAGVAAAEAG